MVKTRWNDPTHHRHHRMLFESSRAQARCMSSCTTNSNGVVLRWCGDGDRSAVGSVGSLSDSKSHESNGTHRRRHDTRVGNDQHAVWGAPTHLYSADILRFRPDAVELVDCSCVGARCRRSIGTIVDSVPIHRPAIPNRQIEIGQNPFLTHITPQQQQQHTRG